MPFAPTPEQCREPWAAIIRQPKFGRIALGDVLNYVHQVCVGKRRVDLGRLWPQILTAGDSSKSFDFDGSRRARDVSNATTTASVEGRPACRPF
jgi:hypothetical protein